MDSSKDIQGSTTNRLLATLPPDEYKRLSAALHEVRLPRNRILCEAGDSVHYAYFLNSGMASLLAITEEGSSIELATVGSEGFIGGPIIDRIGISPYRVTVQATTIAYRMEARQFRLESDRVGPLRELLLRYSHVVDSQLTQAPICYLTHSVEQRLARRLLTMNDCLGSQNFELTQEELSLILDRHRNRISTATIELRERGAIEIDRGKVAIIDRKKLEAATCECYRIVQTSIERVVAA